MEDEEYIRAECNLDVKKGDNWVSNSGGLPDYIHSIACALVEDGHSISSAIAIAVGRCKVWATGKGVDKDTQAKAAAAVAEWEAKKAESHVKRRLDTLLGLTYKIKTDI